MRTLYNGPPVCCPIWASGGKYLLYRTIYDNRRDIWAPPTGKALFRRPPVNPAHGWAAASYSGVSVSRNGKQVFAIGTTDRGELVRYDMKSHQFLPFLSGISAMFTRRFPGDGQWVAYHFYPDLSLLSAAATTASEKCG